MDLRKDWSTSENTVSEFGEFMETNLTLKLEVLVILSRIVVMERN
jgi:hypothetical protein